MPESFKSESSIPPQEIKKGEEEAKKEEGSITPEEREEARKFLSKFQEFLDADNKAYNEFHVAKLRSELKEEFAMFERIVKWRIF